MPELDRIRDAGEVLTEFDIDRYQIFAENDSQKAVTIWQPSGKVKDPYNWPQPIGLKAKAESFLQRASNVDTQLAAAPEWGYNIDWIEEHEKYLFAESGPLFVLGCTPVGVDEMKARLAELNSSYDCFSAEGEDDGTPLVPENLGKEFVTPTIIPIAASARSDGADDALLVQFKNKHMSGHDNDVEERKLSEGSAIWGLQFRSGDAVVVPWTCSDVMDPDLPNQVTTYCEEPASYVVHVQCNPDPFNKTWINFREELFETDGQVSCVVANWGREEQFGRFGYSGVYTSTSNSTTLGTEYNESYERGGLVATRPSYGCEYLCLIPDDIISTVVFRRLTNRGTPSGSATMANLKVAETAVFDATTDTYQCTGTAYPADEPDVCEEWRKELDTSPLNRELLCAILRAKISTENLPEDFDHKRKLTWECVDSLNGEATEELGHLLEDHPRRHGEGKITPSTKDHPADITEKLRNALSFANEEAEIVLKPDFDQSDVPVNAEYEWSDVPICLTTLSGSATRAEIDRAKWFVDWLEVDDIRFKPVALVREFDGSSVKTLAGYEDVSRMAHNPEHVDATNGLEDIEL
jgi:hypothetical protein